MHSSVHAESIGSHHLSCKGKNYRCALGNRKIIRSGFISLAASRINSRLGLNSTLSYSACCVLPKKSRVVASDIPVLQSIKIASRDVV